MALSAALALSGLPRDQFSGELEDIYSPGALLLKSPSATSLASSGYSSGASSRASLTSDCTFKCIENDVWALLDDNELNNDPLDETIIIDLPLKTPEVCGFEETVDIHKSFKYYLSVIAELESRMENYKEKETKQPQQAETKEPKATEVKKYDDIKINYQGRDLLDLGSNLANFASFCTPPKLERTVSNFFENRSVFSRIEGAPPLKFIKVTCQIDDCGFEECIYY